MLAVQESGTLLDVTVPAVSPVGALGGCVSLTAGSTSTAAKFQRSAVGAVSFSVTAVPGSGVAAFCRCTQKVSPTEARYSSAFVCPPPTVRAVALSQSLPTPQTQEPARVVVTVTVGAPVAALAPALATGAVRSAPARATMVIEPT